MTAATTITTRSNPYVTVLLWIGALGIVAAVVLAITGAMTVSQASDIYGSSIGLAKGAAFASAAGIAGFVGVVSFVGGLVILGVRWQPKVRSAASVAAEVPGSLPTSGHRLDKM